LVSIVTVSPLRVYRPAFFGIFLPLKWLHADDGVVDPAKVELFVHALEMVYVPKGSFYVGSGGRAYIWGLKEPRRKQECGGLADGS